MKKKNFLRLFLIGMVGSLCDITNAASRVAHINKQIQRIVAEAKQKIDDLLAKADDAQKRDLFDEQQKAYINDALMQIADLKVQDAIRKLRGKRLILQQNQNNNTHHPASKKRSAK